MIGNKKQKDVQKSYFTYKGRALVRNSNLIYYGKNSEKYHICLKLENFESINGLRISKSVIIKLMQNGDVQGKILKCGKRDSLRNALDLSSDWLDDAVKNH